MKNVLFLQSPLGTFFKYMANHFSTHGHKTFKINFNGGDRVYAGADHQFDYQGKTADWGKYIMSFIDEHNISDLVLYGDCRFYHRVAITVAKAKGIKVWCFEEGYLRAGFITLEQDGCNAYSTLNCSLDTIQSTVAKPVKSEVQVGPTFKKRLWYAVRYYIAATLTQNEFPHYEHHRPWSSWQECCFWLNNFKQKLTSKVKDIGVKRHVFRKFDQKFFLLPLQVQVDYQLREHSPFSSVEEVIKHVVISFAKNANKAEALLIKHHPQDRGFFNYRKLIKRLALQHNLMDRVFYVHDVNLPDIYRHAKGVVTVNSTVGISSLIHHLPTMTLGKALYDIEGITYQGSLNDFWTSNFTVDEELFAKFHSHVQQQTQIPGDFYKGRRRLIDRVYDVIQSSPKISEIRKAS
ncbi:capsular biosynthesis protein [Thalassotalea sp. HSM 43]|uniref:capsule biosynthesis protein n=1 Tax=Thalassotalea sp. HSM 43 TaxID=2552945 RepID=UPI001080408C|nr:capsular biosynthesis protein [Thalassotalea sp. HSM 43]QBY03535.1 capsular biosynthesis protein [Thalassotalea sp. HSM 43]